MTRYLNEICTQVLYTKDKECKQCEIWNFREVLCFQHVGKPKENWVKENYHALTIWYSEAGKRRWCLIKWVLNNLTLQGPLRPIWHSSRFFVFHLRKSLIDKFWGYPIRNIQLYKNAFLDDNFEISAKLPQRTPWHLGVINSLGY